MPALPKELRQVPRHGARVAREVGNSRRREAREALAIHHEHRSKDLLEARRLVLDVLAGDAAGSAREAAAYRLRRIERKLAVRSEGGLMAALEADDDEAQAGA